MTSDELYDAFRVDIVDTAQPYLWSESEVYRYMDAAYKQFVRKMGGIADFTSDATQVDILTGENTSDLHPSILRVMSARLLSSNIDLKVVNVTDSMLFDRDDYRNMRTYMHDLTPGPVRYMVIGAQRDVARWVMVPESDDTVALQIYRLPLVAVTGPAQTLDEISADHHIYLLDYMKHLAYKKQDAETFDKNRSVECLAMFDKYCEQCRAEWERYKHKNRVVTYGGI